MDKLKLIIVFGLTFFGVYSCSQSEWAQESRREMAENAAALAKPHVIREADGCKVYAFVSEARTHYFTRCPDSVTTESSHIVDHGKGQTTVETETIVVGR